MHIYITSQHVESCQHDAMSKQCQHWRAGCEQAAAQEEAQRECGQHQRARRGHRCWVERAEGRVAPRGARAGG